MNVLNGGVHADNPVDFQEFMIAPVGAELVRPGAADRRRGLPRAPAHAQEARAGHGGRRRGRIRAGARLQRGSTRAARELRSRAPAISPGDDVAICLDPAASEFFKDGRYELAGEGRSLSSEEMVEYWSTIPDSYPVVSLEDGMAERDWEGWRKLTERLGSRFSSSVTTSSSPTRRSCARASSAASPTRS